MPTHRSVIHGRLGGNLVEYLRTLHADGADAWCVQHIQAPAEARRLVGRGVEIFGCEPRFVGEVGPVIGAHAGLGMIGVGGLPASDLDG